MRPTQIWEKMYGFIVPDLKKGVIIGEWGGNCKGGWVCLLCNLGVVPAVAWIGWCDHIMPRTFSP